MNETFGVKGDQRDSLRTLKIKKKQKKKLQEYIDREKLAEKEKKVRKIQAITFIKIIPIVFVGKTIQMFIGNTDKDISDKENVSDDITDISDDKKSIIIDLEEEKKYPVKKNISIKKKNESKKEIKVPDTIDVKPIPLIPDGKDVEILDEKNDFVEEISLVDNSVEKEDFSNISPQAQSTLKKLKSRKIVSEYENQLKEVRFELRQLVFDYMTIADEEEKVVFSEEASNLIDKLSMVIWKIEKLKDKIKIDDLDKYDDNYIYTLIENYLAEFRDKRFVSEMKDSPLYILISEKLQELDNKKDDLNSKLVEKKEKLEEREEKFDRLKSRYSDLEKINQDIRKIQEEQEYFYRKIKEQMEKAVSVSERVKVEVEAMDYFSVRMLRLLRRAMLFPGNRAARSIVAMSSMYMYFLNKLINPKMVTKKYKVIEVKDYSEEIENSLSSISEVSNMLYSTNKQISKMITSINEEFSEYKGIYPECDKLLYNLEQMQSNISEKEFEINEIKKKQEKLLEKNNSKVLTRGEYLM